MSVKLTFLGSGDAFNAKGFRHAGYLLDAPGGSWLLDCGPSTLQALKALAIPADRIDGVFLSHLHGDHFGGIPFLFLEYLFESPRRRPLCIAGPPGTEERVAALFRALYRDLSQGPLPFSVDWRVLLPGQPVEVGAARIGPFRVPHQRSGISLGLRVEAAGRTVVYSGDTGWTEALVEQSEGADLFICECCFFETRVDYHLDYPRLHENRHRFRCRRLILSHLGREVHRRAAEVEIEMARDGMTVDV